MWFHSLRLVDVRSVAHRQIDFALMGTTVLCGNNEAGKSTAGEAISILFDYAATSRAEAVRSLKPVDRDVGPEIELVMECGKVRFKYRKRFLKGVLAELTIDGGGAYTGQDAHDKALAVIHENCDLAFWKAIRMMQGDSTALPALTGHVSLEGALNRAAGFVAGDGSDATLIERAHAEYLKYWTRAGKPLAEVERARAALAALDLELAAIEGQIVAVDADATRAGSLEAKLMVLRRHVAEAKADKASKGQAFEQLSRQRANLKDLEHERTQAEHRHSSARAACASRTALLSEIEQATGSLAAKAVAFERLTKESDASRLRLDDALAVRSSAVNLLAASQTALDRVRLEAVMAAKAKTAERLGRVLERYQSLQTVVAADEVRRAAIKLTPTGLERIRKASAAVTLAEARLRDGATRVAIRAVKDLMIDGVALNAGQIRDLGATERQDLAIADVAILEIHPGRSAAELEAATLRAQSELAGLLAANAVESVAAAESILGELKDLDARIAASAKALREVFDPGTTLASATEEHSRLLAELQDHAEASAASAASAGAPGHAGADAGDVGVATAPVPALTEADALAAHEAAVAAKERAEKIAHAEEKTLVDLEKQLAAATSALTILRPQRDAAAKRLVDARVGATDEALAKDLEGCEAALANAHGAFAAAARAVALEAPEIERQLLDATSRLARHEADLGATQDALRDVTTRLETLGVQGLHGQRQAKADAAARCREEQAARDRRAAAAKLLYDTLEHCRTSAQRAYAAPLQRRIESMGRAVYGSSFAVTLDDTLGVSTRSLDGRTLDFDALSTGAKEQLALITRIAACAVASDDGCPVPLILDDILGHTDPDRLRAMQALVDLAGRNGQVIYLTCMPDRASSLAAARTVSIV